MYPLGTMMAMAEIENQLIVDLSIKIINHYIKKQNGPRSSGDDHTFLKGQSVCDGTKRGVTNIVAPPGSHMKESRG